MIFELRERFWREVDQKLVRLSLAPDEDNDWLLLFPSSDNFLIIFF